MKNKSQLFEVLRERFPEAEMNKVNHYEKVRMISKGILEFIESHSPEKSVSSREISEIIRDVFPQFKISPCTIPQYLSAIAKEAKTDIICKGRRRGYSLSKEKIHSNPLPKNSESVKPKDVVRKPQLSRPQEETEISFPEEGGKISVQEYHPQVNVAKELSEISKDFTHPREIIREVISNSIDASASIIKIEILEEQWNERIKNLIRIIDNGSGMDGETIKRFFDLGNSTKGQGEPDNLQIGYKGHGTKITYNSSCVTVFSKKEGGIIWKGTMKDPHGRLNSAISNRSAPPTVIIERVATSHNPEFNDFTSGTMIEVRDYDNDNRPAFFHAPLKDYILWFTAWGRVDAIFRNQQYAPCKLFLKGLRANDFEEIPFGHPFPDECYDFEQLLIKDKRRPESHFVKRWEMHSAVVGRTEKITVFFSVEGC